MLLGEREGLTALRWVRDETMRGDPVARVLVSTRLYTGRIQPEWCDVSSVSQGDAARYPVKAAVHDGGQGQWSFDEVLAVALTETGRMILASKKEMVARGA